jgi:hypothetical protein
MQTVIPGAPVTSNVIDGGGPTAQALLSSSGAAQGFAAFPYPGDTAVAGASTAAGALGSAGVPVPNLPTSYPFAVTADANSPEQQVGSGPYALQAKTSDAGAESSARSGFGQEGAAEFGVVVSEASVKRSAGTVTAGALSRSSAMRIGPLALGNMTSSAKVTLNGDGATTRASTLEITGATVSGTPVGAPPGDAAAFVKALNEALAPSRMRVEYAPAEETPGGVISGALAVTTPFPVGATEGTFRLLFGRVTAVIHTETSEAAVELPPAPTTAEPTAGESPTATAGTDVAPGTFGVAEGTSDGRATAPQPGTFAGVSAAPEQTGEQALTAAAPGGDGTDPADQAGPGAVPSPSPADRPVALATGLRPSPVSGLQFQGSYVLIVLMAFGGLLAGQLVRRVVRRQP